MQLLIIISLLLSVSYQNMLSAQDENVQKQAPSQFEEQKPFKMTVDLDYHKRYPDAPCNENLCATLNPTEITLHPIYNFESLTYPIQIHKIPGEKILYDLDCDGNGIYEFTNLTDDHVCKYNDHGPYQIAIRGEIPGLFLGHRSTLDIDACNKDSNSVLCPDPKLKQPANLKTPFNTGFPVISIDQWGDIKWKTMAQMAKGCVNLKLNAKDAPNLNDVSNISEMFTFAYSFNDNIDHWDVSHVKYMDNLFYEAFPFNRPLEKWDTSNVVSMKGTFRYTNKFNQPLNKWNVSNVADMRYMFANTVRFNQPLNKWNVSSLKTTKSMFEHAQRFNNELNGWNTSNINDMSQMFKFAIHFNQNINDWDTSNVNNMSGMFMRAERFDKPLNKWNTSNVRRMDSMFSEAYAFNQPINMWNTSNVTNMKKMFWFAQKFNKPLDKWNTSNVEYIESMFEGANNFVQDIKNWNLSKVRDDINSFYPLRRTP